VDVSHRRGHFKGRSTLELRLTSLTLDGTRYPLQTRDMDRSKKGKGRRSAAMIGGGTGLGMLVAAWLPEALGWWSAAWWAAALDRGGRSHRQPRHRHPGRVDVNFKLADDLVVQPAQ